MGGSSSRSPALPDPPPPAPPVTEEDDEVRAAYDRERRRISRLQGRESTLLVSPLDDQGKTRLGD